MRLNLFKACISAVAISYQAVEAVKLEQSYMEDYDYALGQTFGELYCPESDTIE